MPSSEDGHDLAETIASRITAEAHRLSRQFGELSVRARACWIDQLLPEDAFASLAEHLPPVTSMIRRRSLKERKYVTAKLDTLSQPLSALVKALSAPSVVEATSAALGLKGLDSDQMLYNGGVTMLVPGDYTRPHLDNSHDLAGRRRRAVVALFYFAPEWSVSDGGHLTLFDSHRLETRVDYAPNRLVFMETTETSWHSVGRVTGMRPRLNTATYYYVNAERQERARLTRFRDWSASPLDLVLEADFRMRGLAQTLGLRKLVRSRHVAATPQGSEARGG